MAQETIITPSISVKPSSSILAGSNMTIECDGAMSGETVLLYKNGGEFLRQQSIGSKTEFSLVDVSLKHQGNYFCMMQSNSRISGHVRITVQDHDRSYLSITPTGSIFFGSNVTLQCNGSNRGETVNLFKNGKLHAEKISSGSTVVFPFSQVGMEHEGSYFCKTSSSSKISNTIYIWVEEETIITPSISVKPNSSILAGSNITIECDGAMSGETVLLYKNGGEFLRQQSIGSKTEFFIVDVSLKHQGNYFCMMQSNSRISEHVRITVQDHDRSFLSITPTGSIFFGSNVTLQCNGPNRGETVNLFKNGKLHAEKISSGSTVVFPFSQVGMEHEGSYFCKTSSSSDSSNTINIWIEEEQYPTILPPGSGQLGITEEKQRDYTKGNIIRISVAGILLVVIIIIVSEYCYSRKKPKMEDNRRATTNEYVEDF